MVSTGKIVRVALADLETWPAHGVLSNIMTKLAGLEVYLAGGVIRDGILERTNPHHDFDFFLGGREVEKALSIFARHGCMRSTPFGSPRWYPHDGPLYCDLIPIVKFHNGLWPCEDILDVLNQFDFTGNAVAIDLRTGAFFDPQNGVRDLQRRVMRAVRLDFAEEPIAPNQPLTRHSVLWFRLLHYAAELCLTIEPITLRWLREHRSMGGQAEAFEAAFFQLHSDYLSPISGAFHA